MKRRSPRRDAPYGALLARPEARIPCNWDSSHVPLWTGAPLPHLTR